MSLNIFAKPYMSWDLTCRSAISVTADVKWWYFRHPCCATPGMLRQDCDQGVGMAIRSWPVGVNNATNTSKTHSANWTIVG